ncbi:MAG: amino acid ABC transporter substrate-binding protein [Candidatus Thiothrix putei]|uniref:Amino acid ABC transporter substrate-binding protein n=1 Tax=Candidatus Thiothrix putei TaxID=3080811 RepID=A0AA95HEF0_9GAMM|nr:MAG: amino acid ABC transporter substrate-binding protein [Candidatus Thiothrix putei]
MITTTLARALAGVTLCTVVMLSLPAQAGKTLDTIKSRDQLVCGVNVALAGFSAADSEGKWSGMDVDYCKALAAAVLGDASKVKYVPLNAQQRFTALQSGEVDILSRNTTWTLTRDASLGANFVGTIYYDGQGFMVKKELKVASAKELDGATVCVQSGTTTEKNLTDFARANKLDIKPLVFEKNEAATGAYHSGRCEAYTTDASGLAAERTIAKNPDEHMILPEIISKEPLGPLVRRGDDEFFAISKWVLNALIEGEEYGLTQVNLDEKKTSDDPNIQRILGTAEDMGTLLGLDKEWAYRALKATGNYGEIFERNVGKDSSLKLERGLNKLWNQGGILYAPPIR